VKPPTCFIDWSEVARTEEDLARAVMVTVIGDEPLATVEEVAAVLGPELMWLPAL
jgi:hypothetical protein